MEVYGKKKGYSPIRDDASRVVVSYGFIPIEGTEDATWHEVYFYKKQHSQVTLPDIKAVITGDINRRVADNIVSGLTWGGKPVWLSEENQMNWKSAYDRAVQTDGENLPVKFKLGETEDGTPVYHTFASLADFGDFHAACLQHIQQRLADGWDEKDSIDWGVYGIDVAGAE